MTRCSQGSGAHYETRRADAFDGGEFDEAPMVLTRLVISRQRPPDLFEIAKDPFDNTDVPYTLRSLYQAISVCLGWSAFFRD